MRVTRLVRFTLAAAAFWAMSGTRADAKQLYLNDFQGGIGTEWSSSHAETAPNPEISSWGRFLGQFSGNESTTLSLANAPTGQVRLSFDTYFIRSWDGDATLYGPDRFGVSLGNGVKLLDDTFSNGNPAGQSYRGDGFKAPAYAAADNTSMTGSLLQYALGYTFWDGIRGTWEHQDSVYHFDFSFYNTSSLLEFTFAASGLQDDMVTAPDGEKYYDESWGLDNVMVQWEEPIPTPEPCTLLLMLCALLPCVALVGWQRKKPEQVGRPSSLSGHQGRRSRSFAQKILQNSKPR